MYKTVIIVVIACIQCVLNQSVTTGNARGNARNQYYKGCHNLPIIRLYKEGSVCLTAEDCLKLQNCTTLYGKLIITTTQNEIKDDTKLVKAYFPNLREVTGYVLIVFHQFKTFDLLPSLSVIRGKHLVSNYAFIVYLNELKGIYFPSLTTILHGGVRIDRNSKLCYADVIRWKSIVKDTFQKEKYGIVIRANNLNCDTSCVSHHCYAVPGHGNDPQAQYCWGPGLPLQEGLTDYQCQKFCAVGCDLQGCVEGSVTTCCHNECLGGCQTANSTFSCNACKNYRIEAETSIRNGECVNKCPDRLVLVRKLYCAEECPGWGKPWKRHYILDGECVKNCPAGYLKNDTTYRCVECSPEESCDRSCNLPEQRIDQKFYKGAIIRVPSDIKTNGLSGCTTINGSLWFEITEGTGNLEEFTKGLRTIKQVFGHIRIQQSPFKDLNFFDNLELIRPKEDQLIHGRYAISVYGNRHLENLWTPKGSNVSIERGNLFFQDNPALCPHVIYDLQNQFRTKDNRNVTGDISEQSNGNRVTCKVQRFGIKLEEVKFDLFDVGMYDRMSKYPECASEKCVSVSWNYTRDSSFYDIIFYKVYYRQLKPNETAEKPITGDFVGNEDWKSKDKERPELPKDLEQKLKLVVGNVEQIITKLTPAARYAFYVKVIVAQGEEKTSDIHYITVSVGEPSAPIGFEASFLSDSSIKLEWRPPDYPNGDIIKYKIYWRRTSYSFWKDQQHVDWCKRDVKADKMSSIEIDAKKGLLNGSCPLSVTSPCLDKREEAEAVSRDRNSHIFMRKFQDELNQHIFVKPRSTQKSKGKNPSFSYPNNNLNDSINSKQSPTTSTSTKSKITKPLRTTSNTITVEPFKDPKVSVSGETLTYIVNGLDYFQDYEFRICACTPEKFGGRCAVPENSKASINSNCAAAQARTDRHPEADNIVGPVMIDIEKNVYNISWQPPIKPNVIVLKYDVLIRFSNGKDTYEHCQSGILPPFFSRTIPVGEYSAMVRAISPAGNGSWSEAVSFKIEESGSKNGLVIGVSVTAVLLCLVLVVFVLYFSVYKRHFEKAAPGVLYASVNPEYMNSNEGVWHVQKCIQNHVKDLTQSAGTYSKSTIETLEQVYIPDEWELNRNKIELVRELGQGSFGMVYEGIAHDIADVPELRVAIKTVNENASIRDRIEFLQEASIMKAFNCHHVVKLIGVVSQGQPTFVVMELMGRHDLKTFLRSRRPEENNVLLPPTKEERYQMAAEIADGMAYLAARKFVHRDLAARNCMVGMDFTVKIGDFGMTRDIYETDYYRKGGRSLLPVRWMAPESLKDGVFRTSSDVWSYGVVLWEICTLAAQPYQGKSNQDVLTHVLHGGQPGFPENADRKIKDIMKLCWQRDANKRPQFLEIIRLLEDDVSEDFQACSFYHEMKKLALEDTFYNENSLYEILGRPSSRTKQKLNGKLSVSSIDSGACIENSKPEADQSPNVRLKNNSPMRNSPPDKDKISLDDMSVNIAENSNRHKKSVYDNFHPSTESVKYGDTPVNKGQGVSEGTNTELRLSKIFLGKAVPV